METDADEQAFVEVKGMTLENKGIGAFPDAPTLRGLKHVTELMVATKAGYRCYILFVVQFEEIKQATIHQEMQPAFAENVGAELIKVCKSCLQLPRNTKERLNLSHR